MTTLPGLSRYSQGGVQLPTGGKGGNPKPASATGFPKKPLGQQIRCNSGADGIVRMKENEQNHRPDPAPAGAAANGISHIPLIDAWF